jgi:hypothetical protein
MDEPDALPEEWQSTPQIRPKTRSVDLFERQLELDSWRKGSVPPLSEGGSYTHASMRFSRRDVPPISAKTD